MAFMIQFRHCTLGYHKFSSAFVLCFHDALYTTLMKSGEFNFTVSQNQKFSTRQFYSLSSRKNNSIGNDALRLKHTTLVQPKLRVFSSAANAPDAFSRYFPDADFDELRDARIKEFKLKGKDINIKDIIRDIVKEKCDEAFANLNAENQRKLKIVQLEHDVYYSHGYHVLPPEEMTSENWLDAMNMTPGKRRRFFHFLQSNVQKKLTAKKKKALKAELWAKESDKLKPAEEDKLFLRVYSSKVKRWQNHRLSSALQYGIPLVWDMDYYEFMNSREIKNTAQQLLDSYCLNRSDEGTPFHFYLTSCSDDNPVFKYMKWYFQNDPHFLATVTPQSCVDVFDKKDLVYLSPHAHQVMDDFNPNAVYIIGGFNDKACHKHVSYAKAKELGIKSLKLPLDHYVDWKLGSKALTLNQMMTIFQGLKNGRSWVDALMALPTRKIK